MKLKNVNKVQENSALSEEKYPLLNYKSKNVHLSQSQHKCHSMCNQVTYQNYFPGGCQQLLKLLK